MRLKMEESKYREERKRLQDWYDRLDGEYSELLPFRERVQLSVEMGDVRHMIDMLDEYYKSQKGNG